MALTLVYGTTTVELTSERVPDSPLEIRPVTVAGVRRTFLGAAKAYLRYRKHAVGMNWTGITSATLGSLKGLSLTGSTVYGTGFDAAVFGSSNVSFIVDRSSWAADESGLNSYDVSLVLEEL